MRAVAFAEPATIIQSQLLSDPTAGGSGGGIGGVGPGIPAIIVDNISLEFAAGVYRVKDAGITPVKFASAGVLDGQGFTYEDGAWGARYLPGEGLAQIATSSLTNATGLALKRLPDGLRVGCTVSIGFGLTCEYRRVVAIDGNAIYFYVTGDTSSINGGDHRLEHTHAAGDIIRVVWDGRVNVQDFGAVPNGTISDTAQATANTTAFNAAFQQAYLQAFAAVYFPGGRYFFDGPIRVEQSTRAIGDKYATQLYPNPEFEFPDDNTACFVLYKDGVASNVDEAPQNGRWDFIDIHLDGQFVAEGVLANGILYSPQQPAHLTGSRIDNMGGYGILIATAQEVWLTHSMIVNCGIHVDSRSGAMVRSTDMNYEAGPNTYSNSAYFARARAASIRSL